MTYMSYRWKTGLGLSEQGTGSPTSNPSSEQGRPAVAHVRARQGMVGISVAFVLRVMKSVDQEYIMPGYLQRVNCCKDGNSRGPVRWQPGGWWRQITLSRRCKHNCRKVRTRHRKKERRTRSETWRTIVGNTFPCMQLKHTKPHRNK